MRVSTNQIGHCLFCFKVIIMKPGKKDHAWEMDKEGSGLEVQLDCTHLFEVSLDYMRSLSQTTTPSSSVFVIVI